MRSIHVCVSFLLVGSLACKTATTTPDTVALGEAGTASLTSAPPDNPSDTEITRTIESAILESRSLERESSDVQVSTSGGVVTLRGHVPTSDEQRRIHVLALHTPGVTTVIDEVTAPEANPSAENDTQMTKAIQEELSARGASDVRFKTIGGKVTLEGSVPTAIERAEIQKVVARVPNVAVVENDLGVRPLAKP